MKIRELIEDLMRYDPELEVAVLDGFNGGGQPRALNFGPSLWDDEQLQEMKEFDVAPDYSDLSTPEGKSIVVIGYGCY